MYKYYFYCGGTCNGPVMVEDENVNNAKRLANQACGCDDCCVLVVTEASDGILTLSKEFLEKTQTIGTD